MYFIYRTVSQINQMRNLLFLIGSIVLEEKRHQLLMDNFDGL